MSSKQSEGRRRAPRLAALLFVPTASILAALLAACQAMGESKTLPATGEVEQLKMEILAEYPHDRLAFTQGLLWHDGSLYESTGQYGKSVLRRVDPTSGAVLAETALDSGFFGEGLAQVGDQLLQLTWHAGTALIWDRESLVLLGQHSYRGLGWGLAYDGERLIMSNSSARLSLRDPKTFAEIGHLDVTFEGQPLAELNELEVAQGAIWANLWMDDRIFRVDPESGKVTAVVDAAGLLTPGEIRRADVLNGIAWDAATETFWITGKYWPKVFQVRFVAAQD